ncbi:MAG: hypothetical protein FRX49_06527 [Trebouxia sp. A1-2]|nr:MAG: hypothetical protein FRX49_06527 [Trebouxia sp. A1-2]
MIVNAPVRGSHFRIISTSGKVQSIRGECRGGNVIVVPLLLEDVAFTAPLPHQQLAQCCTAQRYPVSSRVERGNEASALTRKTT